MSDKRKGYDETLNKRIGEEGKCRKCGGKGELTINPYVSDVHDEIEYEFLCDNCYGEECCEV